MIFTGLGPDHSDPFSITCSQPHPWFPIFGESMGVSCSSPKSCFPFGTCGVSLLGSCCEIETKGVSPSGITPPHPCLGTAHLRILGPQCQGEIKSWKLSESFREGRGSWSSTSQAWQVFAASVPVAASPPPAAGLPGRVCACVRVIGISTQVSLLFCMPFLSSSRSTQSLVLPQFCPLPLSVPLQVNLLTTAFWTLGLPSHSGLHHFYQPLVGGPSLYLDSETTLLSEGLHKWLHL